MRGGGGIPQRSQRAALPSIAWLLRERRCAMKPRSAVGETARIATIHELLDRGYDPTSTSHGGLPRPRAIRLIGS